MMGRREAYGLGALAALLAITVAWWSLALWPLPGEAPDWLGRARAVCFGSTLNGMPDASGWLLLVGQPIGMLAVLLVGWREAVTGGLRALSASVPGRWVLRAATGFLVVATTAAALRVYDARPIDFSAALDEGMPPSTYPRLDEALPTTELVDQGGRKVSLGGFAGHPVLLTFAFGHCETVCPVVVHSTLEAQDRLADLDPVVLVVTLDPWRDTPGRLPHIADQWGLGRDAFVLSGDVDTVEGVLDELKIPRVRDLQTGDITHPALVYIIDGGGKIAYAARGAPEVIEELARRL